MKGITKHDMRAIALNMRTRKGMFTSQSLKQLLWTGHVWVPCSGGNAARVRGGDSQSTESRDHSDEQREFNMTRAGLGHVHAKLTQLMRYQGMTILSGLVKMLLGLCH